MAVVVDCASRVNCQLSVVSCFFLIWSNTPSPCGALKLTRSVGGFYESLQLTTVRAGLQIFLLINNDPNKPAPTDKTPSPCGWSFY
jgi:hypothetical protein